MSITSEIKRRCLIIRINGVLHLSLRTDKLVGVQSWNNDTPGSWFIRYVMDNGTSVLSEYDTREKWLTVLTQLDGLL